MVDAVIKTSGLLLGLFSTALYKSTDKVSVIANDSIIEPTVELVEDVEMFFHKEKTFGLVFLLTIIVIIAIN